MTKLSDINIGIIGATGAVGVEALKLLEKINHPKNKISLFASERSTGKLVEYNKDKINYFDLTTKIGSSNSGSDHALLWILKRSCNIRWD